MKAKFRKEETLNAILYVLAAFEGKCDIHKVSKILYFADCKHLSEYGRLITGDVYIAMQNGPVPSRVYDIFKFLRGDSFFSTVNDPVRSYMRMINRFHLEALCKPDTDWLSESDVECLDHAIAKCRHLGFNELTTLSHDYAWSHTMPDREISYKDMLSETGDEEPYIDYVTEFMRIESRMS